MFAIESSFQTDSSLRVRIRTMSVFTRRASCESHGIVERTLIVAMKADGIGVAVPGT